MANWRRRFLDLFPDLRAEAQRPDFTPYPAFFELLPRVRVAHQHDDAATLRRIYGFARWCLESRSRSLWNPAGVAFYEHLFDSHQRLWPEIVPWLAPRVVEDCWGLWQWRLSKEDLDEIQRLFAECRTFRDEEARVR
jgi:hypothetical protein